MMPPSRKTFANLASSTKALPLNAPNDNVKTQSQSWSFKTPEFCLQEKAEEGDGSYG